MTNLHQVITWTDDEKVLPSHMVSVIQDEPIG